MVNIEKMEVIFQEINNILETAKNVNQVSLQRKDITTDSNQVIHFLLETNRKLKEDFIQLFQYLRISQDSVRQNFNDFERNVNSFNEIIENFNSIKIDLEKLKSEIDKLTKLVAIIQEDTDEIFSLALNASIVSSKFSSTAGVFDILATKLNDMSNFINKNLESIVKVVGPITQGVHDLVDENSYVLDDIEQGYAIIREFPVELDKQKEAIKNLLKQGTKSKDQIDDQQDMLEEINEKVTHMEKDASEAITGSGNVVKMSQNLSQLADEMGNLSSEEEFNFENLQNISEQASTIWHTAQNVNNKSRSQLDFSLSCVEFSDNIINGSIELKKAAEEFNTQFIGNNEVAHKISQNLSKLVQQLSDIEKRIIESNKTVQQFSTDYKEIDNIVEFLKNVLKSMHLIGMYSRIESARDEEAFQGFMTISDNISKLQNNIQSNIPIVEGNISSTYEVIGEINTYFGNVSSVFYNISESANEIITRFKKIIKISSESTEISKSVFDKSIQINNMLEKLRGYLLKLADIVKKPIEGSAANIERGKKIENLCYEMSDKKQINV